MEGFRDPGGGTYSKITAPKKSSNSNHLVGILNPKKVGFLRLNFFLTLKSFHAIEGHFKNDLQSSIEERILKMFRFKTGGSLDFAIFVLSFRSSLRSLCFIRSSGHKGPPNCPPPSPGRNPGRLIGSLIHQSDPQVVENPSSRAD